MKTVNRSSLVLITALVAIAQSAHAQQPPDVVVSDGFENTAMGSMALFSLTYNSVPPPFLGVGNTASGYWALSSNTTGNYNTASGATALNRNTTGNDNASV